MSELEFEGLDIGGDDSAVDDAFAEAFRRSEEGDTGAQEDVTTDEQSAASEPARDDQGRFLKPTEEIRSEGEELDEDEQAAADAAAAAGQTDPDVEAFLARYGGDPEKALKGAVELDRLRGRQGDEVGQLRQEVEQLRSQLQAPTQPATPITAEVVEALDQHAMTDPRAALVRAHAMDPTGQLTDRVMDIWFATNPREASAAQAAAIAAQTEQRIRSEYEPLTARDAQSQQDKQFVEAWDLALATRPDMNDVAPAMQEVLNENTALAEALLAIDDTEKRASLLAGVYEIAKARMPAAADPEVERVAKEQAAVAAKQAKTQARVAKPSAVGAAPGAGGAATESTEESRIKAGILGASSSDVLSGLTTE